MDCDHVNKRLQVGANIVHLQDSGGFMAELTITCECGKPFRFVGVDAGVSFDGPRTSIEGRTLVAPIEPEDVVRLARRSTYAMPSPRQDGF